LFSSFTVLLFFFLSRLLYLGSPVLPSPPLPFFSSFIVNWTEETMRKRWVILVLFINVAVVGTMLCVFYAHVQSHFESIRKSEQRQDFQHTETGRTDNETTRSILQSPPSRRELTKKATTSDTKKLYERTMQRQREYYKEQAKKENTTRMQSVCKEFEDVWPFEAKKNGLLIWGAATE